ncbi:MAG: phytanoyl-CoA dioxygenase family protein [Polyangiaceae bacterium]
MHPSELLFSTKLAALYALGKMRWLHPALPQKLMSHLPVGWNREMFWRAFTTGGTRIYDDLYCEHEPPRSYAPRAEVAPEYRLEEAQIRSFHDKGYTGPFDLLTESEIAALRAHLVGDLIQSDSPWKYELHEGRGFADWLFNRDEAEIAQTSQSIVPGYGRTINRHLDDERLLSLFSRPEITKRVAQLVGPDLLLVRSNFFEVKPGSKGTQFHQASTWLFDDMRESTANPENPRELWQVTCWIALTDANEDNGCLVMIPGSHDRMYPLIIQRSARGFDPSSPYKQGAIDFPFKSARHDPIPVKAGQFLLFTERVIHGSLPNRTSASRWAVNCRYAKTSTRLFSERTLKEGVVSTYGAYRNVSMHKWRAVLVHGEDRYGHNKLD